MVRLRGPGLAQSAAGGLGKTLIYSESKGRAYCKRWAAPANPNTFPQKAIRAMTQFIAQQWNHFLQAERDSWIPLAEPTNIPPYNACLAYNLLRARENKGPTAFYPPDYTGTDPGAAAPATSKQGRQAKFIFNVWTIADLLCYRIHNSPDGTFTFPWDRVIHLQPILTTGYTLYYYGPLSPGTYYFDIHMLRRHGYQSPTSWEKTIVIT